MESRYNGNIEVTDDMIHSTRSAHVKYKAFLEQQRKERELKAQKKKSARLLSVLRKMKKKQRN